METQVRTRPPLIRLTPIRRWLIYGIGAGVWTSGVLWLIFHYFLMRSTEFGPAPNPLEQWWLAIHAGFGFATMWIMGLLWGVHIVGGWRMRRHCVSGVALLTFLGWLVLSGYLLYYVGSDELRSSISLAHWIVGLTLPVLFLAHWLIRNR